MHASSKTSIPVPFSQEMSETRLRLGGEDLQNVLRKTIEASQRQPTDPLMQAFALRAGEMMKRAALHSLRAAISDPEFRKTIEQVRYELVRPEGDKNGLLTLLTPEERKQYGNVPEFFFATKEEQQQIVSEHAEGQRYARLRDLQEQARDLSREHAMDVEASMSDFAEAVRRGELHTACEALADAQIGLAACLRVLESQAVKVPGMYDPDQVRQELLSDVSKMFGDLMRREMHLIDEPKEKVRFALTFRGMVTMFFEKDKSRAQGH
jgi:hypothetical protein